MTHFAHPGKKYNRSSLLSQENNSRHKKSAPERHVHFYFSNPLSDNSVAEVADKQSVPSYSIPEISGA